MTHLSHSLIQYTACLSQSTLHVLISYPSVYLLCCLVLPLGRGFVNFIHLCT